MRFPGRTLAFLALLLSQTPVHACMWDSDTLADEKNARPTMAVAILGNPPDLGDPAKLRKRITELQSNRRENDSAWWNDLAGAHIRLGESKIAAKLLESVVTRFPDDYGIHANLGTAYHLLGRYQEAEKEIARDLEINPDAHFGLEKYHLALLQYLIRDEKYQRRHVFVDEFTPVFLSPHPEYAERPNEGLATGTRTNSTPADLADSESFYEDLIKDNSGTDHYLLIKLLASMAELDETPTYRAKWNLATDTNLQAGVIYMATLNPKQPACFVMLGTLCLKNRDLNMAGLAFDRAVKLGSPQTLILTKQIVKLQEHIAKARSHRNALGGAVGVGFVLLVVIPVCGYYLLRAIFRSVAKLTLKKS